MAITARQRRVLDYIKHYFDVASGSPPPSLEIGQEFGMSSSASVHHVVFASGKGRIYFAGFQMSVVGIELVKDEPAPGEL